MAHLVFILLALIWGSSFILMKKGRLAFDPVSIGAWRVIAGAAVLAALWAIQREAWPLRKSDLPPMLLVAVLGYALPFAAQPYVINHTSSALMGLVVGLSPL